VQKRWILGEPVHDEGLLNTPELGPVADVVSMHEAVERIRPMPLDTPSLVAIVAPALLPMIPVTVIEVPLKIRCSSCSERSFEWTVNEGRGVVRHRHPNMTCEPSTQPMDRSGILLDAGSTTVSKKPTRPRWPYPQSRRDRPALVRERPA
jgi:hypothetical protein